MFGLQGLWLIPSFMVGKLVESLVTCRKLMQAPCFNKKTLIMMDMDMVMMATMGEGGWCAEKRFDANSA